MAMRRKRRNQKNGTPHDVVTRFSSIENINREGLPAMESTDATAVLPPSLVVTEAARRLGITAPTAWALVEKKELAGFRTRRPPLRHRGQPRRAGGPHPRRHHRARAGRRIAPK